MARFQRWRRLLAKELPALSLVFAPLAVFILGYLLFDWIGSPFAGYVLKSTESASTGINPSEVISDGHVWAATAHLYLITSGSVLVVLCYWIRSRARSLAALAYSVVAAALVIIGVAYLLDIDRNNRPIKTIFLFTFRSLETGATLGSAKILDFVNTALTTINVIGVVIPAILCAFAPLLVRDPEGGWTEKELINRVKETRMLGLSACIFLVAGILHMYAWMSWAPELLNKKGLEVMVGSVAFYWGSVFTMMLAAFYFPILFVLQSKAEQVMDAQLVPLIEREQWLLHRGLSQQIINQLPQVIGILAPLIAAPAGKMMSNLSLLLPK
jgi:hypothetical protein